jgi:ribonuclease Z
MSGETLQVYFLGTAGALPTPARNAPCIMVRRGSDTLLFDCGEGAQQQMMRARTGFTVDAVFVTHWHADHFLGIAGLVQTLSFTGRTDPLPVYGPAWVHEAVSAIRSLSRFSLRFSISSVQMSHGSEIRFSGYTVQAFATDHGMESFGYILVEDERPGRFNRDQAVALGIPPGPLFGRLQRGETVCVAQDGESVHVSPDQVMGPPRPGRKIVYTGDTRPVTSRIRETAQNPDLLIHDATYDDADKERAAEVFHATAREAGEVAAALHARTLALVHISSRYTSAAGHVRDAERVFSGTVLAPSDLDLVEIPFREDGA